MRKNLRCPICHSTLFHMQQDGKFLVLKCYRTEKCGWEFRIANAKGFCVIEKEI